MAKTHSAVPFPLILSQPSDQQPSPSRTKHTSPVLPVHWDPQACQIDFPHLFGSPTPTQSQSQSPSQKTFTHTLDGSSQPHTPLTPPLTPASSTNIPNPVGQGTGTAYATPPARGSAAPPPTPSSAGLFSHTPIQRDAPLSPVAVSSGIGASWPDSPQRARPRHLDDSAATISSQSERSIDLSDELVADAIDGRFERGLGPSASNLGSQAGAGGERFLLISGVPKEASSREIQDTFRPCGDVKGLSLRFQASQGVVILAFYDCRHVVHAERHVVSQTYFGNLRLRAEKMAARDLRTLLGDSSFVDETEGEVLVTADGGKLEADSLKSIVSGFGELRSFTRANVSNAQTYIADFFDSRNARTAIGSLNGRSIFGNPLSLVMRHTAPGVLGVPFPQNAEQSHASYPSSPLSTFSTLHVDTLPQLLPPSRLDYFNYSPDISLDTHEQQQQQYADIDTTNSSPFHTARTLPAIPQHTPPAHSGAGRRISTGSVNLPTPLHQSASDQDLRRRAAVAAANAVGTPQSTELGLDHTRRTSDTLYFETLRKVMEQVGILHTDSDGLLRPRTRAISDSSASPRVISPNGDFPAAGVKEAPSQRLFDEPSTPEKNYETAPERSTHCTTFDGDMMDRTLANGHMRMSTVIESSPNGPHTPSPPGAVYATPSYYAHGHSTAHAMTAHQTALLGMTMSPASMLSPYHGQYYLSPSPGLESLMSPQASRIAMTYPYTAGCSPGSVSIPSTLSSPPVHVSHVHSGGQLLPSPVRGAVDITRDSPPERNQIDLDKIAGGLDTRTTVMIKNIPNKLSDKDLVDFINKVCPRKIDFLYLRMDFQNGCNVGYAFVNFIHVEDLLYFARAKLGVKWNMFSSEKVLQMSYANYQGKEALVEKFKNSCVMDERESWRPKIFYSSGPNQGLPEPFPSPTHFRRKERSAQNRGALFVPSPPHAAMSGNGGTLNHTPFRRPNQHPQNLARHDRY